MKPLFKKAAILLLIAIALAALVTLCGCNNKKDTLIDADYIFDIEGSDNASGNDFDGTGNTDDGLQTIYTVTYANGNRILTTRRVVSNSAAENLQIKDTDDYEFVGWTLNGEEYDFSTPVTRDIRLDALWKAIEHTATFMCDDKVVGVCKFSAECKQIVEPEPPERVGYYAEWSDYELGSVDVEIQAKYKKIVYNMQFFAYRNGELIAEKTCTIDEMENENFPAVPEREGYIGEWRYYEVFGELVKVYAEYTLLPSNPPDGDDDTENKKPPVEEQPEDTDSKLEGTEGLVCTDVDGGVEVTGYEGAETKVIIPSSYDGKAVIAIGAYAFKSSAITEVYICEGVKTIKSGAFYLCASLEKVTLPESLEAIERSAFDGTAIKELVLPQKIKEINTSTFANCKSLETVTIPEGLTVIGAQAFKNCVKLKYINLFNVLEIKAYAFENCTALSDLEINKNTVIDSTAFPADP